MISLLGEREEIIDLLNFILGAHVEPTIYLTSSKFPNFSTFIRKLRTLPLASCYLLQRLVR